MIVLFRKQFRIVSAMNNKVIDIEGGQGNPGDFVVMMTPQTGKKSQLWYFDAQGYIRSAVNDYACDTGLNRNSNYREGEKSIHTALFGNTLS